QARLRHLEALIISAIPLSSQSSNSRGDVGDEQPTSSLVARILNKAALRTDFHPEGKSKAATRPLKAPEVLLWDELEIDHLTENDVLANSLSEAIADVATASAQLRAAFAQLNGLVQK